MKIPKKKQTKLNFLNILAKTRKRQASQQSQVADTAWHEPAGREVVAGTGRRYDTYGERPIRGRGRDAGVDERAKRPMLHRNCGIGRVSCWSSFPKLHHIKPKKY